MIYQTGLLDALSIQAGCTYLSDLRYLHGWERVRLARILRKLPPGAATLNEWNDAFMYLSNGPPQTTAAAARERLLQSLSRPQ